MFPRHEQYYEERLRIHMETLQQTRSTKFDLERLRQNISGPGYDPVQQTIDLWLWLKIKHKEAFQKLEDLQSSKSEPIPKNTQEFLPRNFVEHSVGVSQPETSFSFWGSKVPMARHISKEKKIPVSGRYHKVRKRRMKPGHCSQSLRLAYRVCSPRNHLYLGDDSLRSMTVHLANENQITATWRARFKQRFHQFQKRRSRERYRVVIASFRSKHYSWVVAKKVEKNSSHKFSFPPLNHLSVGDNGGVTPESCITLSNSIKTNGDGLLPCPQTELNVMLNVQPSVNKNINQEPKATRNLYPIEVWPPKTLAEHKISIELVSSWIKRVWEPGGCLVEHDMGVWLERVYKRDRGLRLMQRNFGVDIETWIHGLEVSSWAYKIQKRMLCDHGMGVQVITGLDEIGVEAKTGMYNGALLCEGKIESISQRSVNPSLITHGEIRVFQLMQKLHNMELKWAMRKDLIELCTCYEKGSKRLRLLSHSSVDWEKLIDVHFSENQNQEKTRREMLMDVKSSSDGFKRVVLNVLETKPIFWPRKLVFMLLELFLFIHLEDKVSLLGENKKQMIMFIYKSLEVVQEMQTSQELFPIWFSGKNNDWVPKRLRTCAAIIGKIQEMQSVNQCHDIEGPKMKIQAIVESTPRLVRLSFCFGIHNKNTVCTSLGVRSQQETLEKGHSLILLGDVSVVEHVKRGEALHGKIVLDDFRERNEVVGLHTSLNRSENERCCECINRKNFHSYVRLSERLRKSHETSVVEVMRTLSLLIKAAYREVKTVKIKEEYSENQLVSTIAYEVFHSPRPPELLFGKIGSCFLYLIEFLEQGAHTEHVENGFSEFPICGLFHLSRPPELS